MSPKKQMLAAAILAALLLAAPAVFAHGGGRDGNGGHNDRKHGGYHFHTGPLAGQSFGSKAEALAALNGSSGGPRAQTPSPAARAQRAVPPEPATSAAAPQASGGCNCDALAELLISKGIITREELAAAWQGQ